MPGDHQSIKLPSAAYGSNIRKLDQSASLLNNLNWNLVIPFRKEEVTWEEAIGDLRNSSAKLAVALEKVLDEEKQLALPAEGTSPKADNILLDALLVAINEVYKAAIQFNKTPDSKLLILADDGTRLSSHVELFLFELEKYYPHNAVEDGYYVDPIYFNGFEGGESTAAVNRRLFPLDSLKKLLAHEKSHPFELHLNAKLAHSMKMFYEDKLQEHLLEGMSPERFLLILAEMAISADQSAMPKFPMLIMRNQEEEEKLTALLKEEGQTTLIKPQEPAALIMSREERRNWNKYAKENEARVVSASGIPVPMMIYDYLPYYALILKAAGSVEEDILPFTAMLDKAKYGACEEDEQNAFYADLRASLAKENGTLKERWTGATRRLNSTSSLFAKLCADKRALKFLQAQNAENEEKLTRTLRTRGVSQSNIDSETKNFLIALQTIRRIKLDPSDIETFIAPVRTQSAEKLEYLWEQCKPYLLLREKHNDLGPQQQQVLKALSGSIDKRHYEDLKTIFKSWQISQMILACPQEHPGRSLTRTIIDANRVLQFLQNAEDCHTLSITCTHRSRNEAIFSQIITEYPQSSSSPSGNQPHPRP